MAFIVDVTDEKQPVGVSTFNVPEASGISAAAAGASARTPPIENQPPMYAGRTVFMAWFNAGAARSTSAIRTIRAEIGYYIPATTDRTDKRCVKAARRRRALQGRDPDQQPRRRRPRLHLHRCDRANPGCTSGALAAMRKALSIVLCAVVTLATRANLPFQAIRLIVPFGRAAARSSSRAPCRPRWPRARQNFVVENKAGRAAVISRWARWRAPSPTATR